MKIQRENKAPSLVDESSQKTAGLTLAPRAFSVTASADDAAATQSGEHAAMEAETLSPGLDQSQSADAGGGDDNPMDQLRKLLNRKVFQHKNQIPQLIYELSPDQKAGVRESELFRAEICDALKKDAALMRKALIGMESTLPDQLRWMSAWQKASYSGNPGFYSEVRQYITNASQPERELLKTNEFKLMLRAMSSDDRGEVGILDDLNFDSRTKLEWYRYFQIGPRFSHIQSWFTTDGGAAEALQAPEIRAWFLELCDAGELIQASTAMGEPLAATVAWLQDKEKLKRIQLTYPQLKMLLQNNGSQVEALLDTQETQYFLQHNATAEELQLLVKDCKLPLGATLRLMTSKYSLDGIDYNYQKLRGFILAAPADERMGLKEGPSKALLMKVCDDKTIYTAIQDLGFDIGTKLEWLKAMKANLAQIPEAQQLEYGGLRPMVTGAQGADKEYLQTPAGQDQVMALGAGKSIGTAVADLDLNLPLKEKIERVYTAAGVESVQVILDAESQAARDKIWKDKDVMAHYRELMGDDHYLTLICALRMRYAGTANLEQAAEVDQAIIEHLGDFVKGSVQRGVHVEGMVAVVDEGNWDIAGELECGASEWGKNGKKNWAGFVDKGRRAFVHKDKSQRGDMIHEAVHKYSTLGADGIIAISQPLNEGITEYFTRKVCVAASIKAPDLRAYEKNFLCVQRLVALLGEKVVATAFFDGPGIGLGAAFEKAKGKNGPKLWEQFVAYTKENKWAQAEKLL